MKKYLLPLLLTACTVPEPKVQIGMNYEQVEKICGIAETYKSIPPLDDDSLSFLVVYERTEERDKKGCNGFMRFDRGILNAK